MLHGLKAAGEAPKLRLWQPQLRCAASLSSTKRPAQVKIAPETALKLSFNDAIKHVIASDPEYITALERMVGGAIAGASAQVPLHVFPRLSHRHVASCLPCRLVLSPCVSLLPQVAQVL